MRGCTRLRLRGAGGAGVGVVGLLGLAGGWWGGYAGGWGPRGGLGLRPGRGAGGVVEVVVGPAVSRAPPRGPSSRKLRGFYGPLRPTSESRSRVRIGTFAP